MGAVIMHWKNRNNHKELCVYVFNISSDAEMHTQITDILAIHVRHRGKTECRNIGMSEYKFECTLLMI